MAWSVAEARSERRPSASPPGSSRSGKRRPPSTSAGAGSASPSSRGRRRRARAPGSARRRSTAMRSAGSVGARDDAADRQHRLEVGVDGELELDVHRLERVGVHGDPLHASPPAPSSVRSRRTRSVCSGSARPPANSQRRVGQLVHDRRARATPSATSSSGRTPPIRSSWPLRTRQSSEYTPSGWSSSTGSEPSGSVTAKTLPSLSDRRLAEVDELRRPRRDVRVSDGIGVGVPSDAGLGPVSCARGRRHCPQGETWCIKTHDGRRTTAASRCSRRRGSRSRHRPTAASRRWCACCAGAHAPRPRRHALRRAGLGSPAEVRAAARAAHPDEIAAPIYEADHVARPSTRSTRPPSTGRPYDIVHDHSGFVALAFADRLATPLVHTLHGPFSDDTCAFYARHGQQGPRSSRSAATRRARRARAADRRRRPQPAASSTTCRSCEDKERLSAVGRAHERRQGPAPRDRRRARGGRPARARRPVQPGQEEFFATRGRAAHRRTTESATSARSAATTSASSARAASAFLMPIRWAEPFGLVMTEAMACGTPVIAFPEGSAPEVVADGETGFLVDDEHEMAAAVGRARRDRAARAAASGSPSASTSRPSPRGTSACTRGRWRPAASCAGAARRCENRRGGAERPLADLGSQECRPRR